MPRRLLPLFGMLLVVCVASSGADSAFAASRICRQLEAELSGGGRAKFSAEKYDAAIVRQRDEMTVAEAQRLDAGCGFAIAARNVRMCAALTGTIARMKRNLQVLQRDRRAALGGVSAKDRIRLLEELDANDCRNQAPSLRPDREAATELPSPADANADQPQFLDDFMGEKQDAPADAIMPPSKPPVDPDGTAGPSSVVTIAPATAVEPAKPMVIEQHKEAITPQPERSQGDRKVRVVGPAFLPDPSAAEGLPVLAPKTVP